MKRAIKALQDKVEQCENMKKWFDTQLVTHQHITADQIEVQKIKLAQEENLLTIKECEETINKLKGQ